MGSIIFFLIVFFIIIPKLQQADTRRRAEAQRRYNAQRAAQNAAAQSAEAAQRAAQSAEAARRAAEESAARAPKYRQDGAAGKNLWERLRDWKDGQSEQALAQKKAFGLAGGVAGSLIAALFAIGMAGGLSEMIWSISNGFFFTEELLLTLFSALCAAGGGLLAFVGFGTRRRAQNFEWYRAIIGDRRECPVADIARATGRSPRQVLRELRDMVRHGYFPLGFVDEETACFYADNEAYRQHKAERAAPAPQEPPAPAPEADGPLGDAHLREYKRQLERVRESAVHEKAARLCEHAEDIFAWVRLHPECADDVRRFCNYYLPTANKLLATYNEIAPHTGESSVADQIEGEVLRVLDTMTTAFRGLMDHLLQNTAVDMQAEISALETILAQEGLTQDGLIH